MNRNKMNSISSNDKFFLINQRKLQLMQTKDIIYYCQLNTKIEKYHTEL